MSIVNPITVLGFIKELERRGENVVINNGAYSQLGQIFIRECLYRGIKTINIVRQEYQIQLLKDIGATYVLNYTH